MPPAVAAYPWHSSRLGNLQLRRLQPSCCCPQAVMLLPPSTAASPVPAGLVKSYKLPTMDSEILQVAQGWGTALCGACTKAPTSQPACSAAWAAARPERLVLIVGRTGCVRSLPCSPCPPTPTPTPHPLFQATVDKQQFAVRLSAEAPAIARLLASFHTGLEEVTLVALPEGAHRPVHVNSFIDPQKGRQDPGKAALVTRQAQ